MMHLLIPIILSVAAAVLYAPPSVAAYRRLRDRERGPILLDGLHGWLGAASFGPASLTARPIAIGGRNAKRTGPRMLPHRVLRKPEASRLGWHRARSITRRGGHARILPPDTHQQVDIA
jgi:hypothetical protein